MPELPTPNSESANSKNLSFQMNVPVVHSISSGELLKQGWILFGRETIGQSIIAIYKKGKDEIRYNGARWVLNNKEVQFMEDLTQTTDNQNK